MGQAASCSGLGPSEFPGLQTVRFRLCLRPTQQHSSEIGCLERTGLCHLQQPSLAALPGAHAQVFALPRTLFPAGANLFADCFVTVAQNDDQRLVFRTAASQWADPEADPHLICWFLNSEPTFPKSKNLCLYRRLKCLHRRLYSAVQLEKHLQVSHAVVSCIDRAWISGSALRSTQTSCGSEGTSSPCLDIPADCHDPRWDVDLLLRTDRTAFPGCSLPGAEDPVAARMLVEARPLTWQ